MLTRYDHRCSLGKVLRSVTDFIMGLRGRRNDHFAYSCWGWKAVGWGLRKWRLISPPKWWAEVAHSTSAPNTYGNIKGKAVIFCKTLEFVRLSQRHYEKEHQENITWFEKKSSFIAFRISRAFSALGMSAGPVGSCCHHSCSQLQQNHCLATISWTLLELLPWASRSLVGAQLPINVLSPNIYISNSFYGDSTPPIYVRNPHRVSDHSTMIKAFLKIKYEHVLVFN